MKKFSIVLIAGLLGLAGCAAEGPMRTIGIEQKIENSRTTADHTEIAEAYEKQAEIDRTAAQRHRDLSRAYEKGWVWEGPKVGGVVSARKGNQNFIAHCENLARIHELAASENLSLAKMHRELAATR